MTATCFICGRPAQHVRDDEPVCGHHRLGRWSGAVGESYGLLARIQPDALHARRLLSFHGPERTARILAGEDPETEADLAGWRRLGALAEAG